MPIIVNAPSYERFKASVGTRAPYAAMTREYQKNPNSTATTFTRDSGTICGSRSPEVVAVKVRPPTNAGYALAQLTTPKIRGTRTSATAGIIAICKPFAG